ncbi:hypothetical protein ACFSQJ_15705 [Croceitalea marina]|uniref:SGNH hydrolase-type esterase domain-containing protein n=1 Tax=Croceitalea marina TaxID=1775166 RepID=A0ABW5MYI9_9FLAO
MMKITKAFDVQKLSCWLILLAFTILLAACSTEPASLANDEEATDEEVTDEQGNDNPVDENFNADINNDGELNILFIGSSRSIQSDVAAFSLNNVAEELNSILSQDATITAAVNVSYEDIYNTKALSTALGSGGNEFDYTYYTHSLFQYYHWPEGQAERISNLKGNGEKDWDYVIMASDPYIISKTPGFYSLGVNQIAATVIEGGAKALLVLPWPKDEAKTTTISSFEEFTYRTASGAKVDLEVVPAGLAWENLEGSLKDGDNVHPSPNGAYLTAASIYAQLYDKSASTSAYTFNDVIADEALTSTKNARTASHFSGEFNFTSPFKSCDIDKSLLRYNHTGTSSENGIMAGLNWVINKDDQTQLERDGAPLVDFNMGRANTNFEANKRYKIDASKFDFSFGFPMQDGSATGNTTMRYGIDKRGSQNENGTDLGVALYMVRQNELPTGRAIPIRALYAQMKELNIATSAYRDSWHMSRDLDKAAGAYMCTLLTGRCDLGMEPMDQSSGEWKTWRAHKLGYETAYTLMTLKGDVPECN